MASLSDRMDCALIAAIKKIPSLKVIQIVCPRTSVIKETCFSILSCIENYDNVTVVSAFSQKLIGEFSSLQLDHRYLDN
jgi:hypothetical protein